MKVMVPIVSFMAGGLTCLGLWAYSTNKKEMKNVMKSMTDLSDSMMKKVKNVVSSK